MYRLIIADDERIVLTGIKNTIDWASLDVEVVATAQDGEELYQKFQTYIDSVTENLVRKDQANVTITGVFQDKNGKTSKNDFTDELKLKLEGIENKATKTEIEDSLTSDSPSKALSAQQGKKIKEILDEKQNKITRGTSNPTGGKDGDIYIQYFN